VLGKEAALKKETDRAYGGFRDLLLRVLTLINDNERKSDPIKTLAHRIYE